MTIIYAKNIYLNETWKDGPVNNNSMVWLPMNELCNLYTDLWKHHLLTTCTCNIPHVKAKIYTFISERMASYNR